MGQGHPRRRHSARMKNRTSTMPNVDKIVRIGGASGFWGDSAAGPAQLLQVPDLDYITFDYLAELTMSILTAAKLRNPDRGYATDFVDVTLRRILKACSERRIRLISNAGGINPHACARAVKELAATLGVDVSIAVVDGDDLMPRLPELRTRGYTDFYTSAAMPERLLSANAYLGAAPIARALAEGADIVITGRVVDSAVVLGALMHEFGWAETDHDLLAAGSLAGHIIECGCQATGGLHTDWQDVPDWANMGYPVIECRADGSFVVGKPDGTGGLVRASSVAEQMLYEIGDPANYILPDVVCDFSQVSIRDIGPQRVEVSGARGKPAPDTYKVSATYQDGYRCLGTLTVVGFDAAAKARRSGEAILERTRSMFHDAGFEDYSATTLNVLGTEELYGPHARTHALREAIMRLAVRHPQKAALELFAREISPAGTSWAPGTTGALSAGRPSVSPLVRLFSFVVSKSDVTPRLTLDDREIELSMRSGSQPVLPEPIATAAAGLDPDPATSDDDIEVLLIEAAYGRSGDKGDTSNIGIIARTPALLPYLRREVTAERVRDFLAHLVNGEVRRFDLPGVHAMNFVLANALDGGGMASLRNDPLGKSMAQILLSMSVRIPPSLLATGSGGTSNEPTRSVPA